MFVHNNFKHDSRVLREARTLAEDGYGVRVIALLEKVTEPYEERDGFRVIRVKKDPIHYKSRRRLRKFLLVNLAAFNVERILADSCLTPPKEPSFELQITNLWRVSSKKRTFSQARRKYFSELAR